MPIFDAKGMLKGKRLRKIRPLAHALWPFIFSQASDVLARLELDYELIAHELGHLDHLFYALNEIDESAPCGVYGDQYRMDAETVLGEVFKDYIQARLCLVYEHKGIEWVVFDKPNKLRLDYLTVQDKDSPAPPEPEFTDWLKSIHGDDWTEYHPSQTVPDELRAKRAEAGRRGGLAKAGKQTMANDDTLPDLPESAKQLATGVRCLVLGVRSSENGGAEATATPLTTMTAPQVEPKPAAAPKPEPTSRHLWAQGVCAECKLTWAKWCESGKTVPCKEIAMSQKEIAKLIGAEKS